jgi:Flp pilus assembly protein TadD
MKMFLILLLSSLALSTVACATEQDDETSSDEAATDEAAQRTRSSTDTGRRPDQPEPSASEKAQMCKVQCGTAPCAVLKKYSGTWYAACK